MQLAQKQTLCASAGGEVACKNMVGFHQEPENSGHLSSLPTVHAEGTNLLQQQRASRYPKESRELSALCCSGAWELLSWEQREGQSLELSSFLGTKRGLDFSGSAGHDSRPLWDCVLLT